MRRRVSVAVMSHASPLAGVAVTAADPALSRRWLILGVGWAAQAAMCCFAYGIAMLVPAIRHEEHVSLAAAGVVVASPGAGLLLTLFAWGYAADRWGERLVIVSGLVGAAGFLGAACFVHGLPTLCVLLALAGAAGASVNAASGRVVLGWFAAHERGLAMGVRQTAQPLGVGFAAVALPPLARHGLSGAFAFIAAVCAAAALLAAVLIVDPPRRPRRHVAVGGSPYRAPRLWRLHAASAALVVPQFAVSAFVLEYLVAQRHWPVLVAGRLVFAMQVAGALGRIAAGVWSDRVHSRLRPMRQIAVLSALTMLAVALGDATGSWLVVLAFAAGAVVSVTDNGLGFTAVAEIAGDAWAGRALGAQNTAQNVIAMLTAPLLGVLIDRTSYAWAFGVAALFPVLAVAVTPVSRRGEPEV